MKYIYADIINNSDTFSGKNWRKTIVSDLKIVLCPYLYAYIHCNFLESSM